jgi:hypothetical protein
VGVWRPVTDNSYLSSKYTGSLSNTFHALLPLGTSGQYGMVVAGWGYSGWPPTLSTAAPVSVALLTPDASGKLSINTSQYISDPVTNGAGAVLIADFNEDGKADIFLPAHNESPFVATRSTAWLSNASGGYTKTILNDLVMAHDAGLVYLNGKPTVITATFINDGNGTPIPGALVNPIYTYSNGSFVISTPPNIQKLGGMDGTLVNNGPGAGSVIVRGDVTTYTPDWKTALTQTIEIYPFNGTDAVSLKPSQVITPYLSTLPQYKDFPSQIGGPGLTHTYRLWADDLNNDGKEDLLAGQSMWSQTNPNYPSALQILMNDGTGTFKDATAKLNPDMALNISELDYNPSFVDLDHSGINTYLFSGMISWGSMARQSDYVLLNDGTGRLYVGLHDEFATLAKQVFAYLDMSYSASSTPPRFVAVPQPDGSLNFVAVVPTGVNNSAVNIVQDAYQFLNVPLSYNPTSDFTKNVAVSDRNNSTLIRTWAGDDTFTDVNANSTARIDGGVGKDSITYSHTARTYSITRNGDGSITVAGNGLTDTLVNMDRLKFSDKEISLHSQDRASYQVSQNQTGATTVVGNGKTDVLTEVDRAIFRDSTLALDVGVWETSGAAYRLYQAAFARTPDKAGLKYWISQMDIGQTNIQVAHNFIVSNEYKVLYGADPTHDQFLTALYQNVLGRAPDKAGHDYWLNLLDTKQITPEQILINFSESTENVQTVGVAIQQGIWMDGLVA